MEEIFSGWSAAKNLSRYYYSNPKPRLGTSIAGMNPVPKDSLA